MSLTAARARRQLPALIQQVNDDQLAVEIVAGGARAFLVPADEYRAMRETVYLLQSSSNAERLHASLEELRR